MSPDNLPVLGIVAVGSGLALIIFGISSFLIYRYILFFTINFTVMVFIFRLMTTRGIPKRGVI